MKVIKPYWRRLARRTVRTLSAVAVLSFAGVSWAHSGHGTEEVGVYDLDAPRTVSEQTAKHIGLKIAEVQMRPIEEVVKLSGTVKPRPDRQHAVVSLLEGQVAQVHVRVGDRVEAGQALIEIKSLPFLERWSKLRMFQARIQALKTERDAAAEQLQLTERLAGQTIPERELILRKAALAKVQELKDVIGSGGLISEANLAAVSVVGSGMQHTPVMLHACSGCWPMYTSTSP